MRRGRQTLCNAHRTSDIASVDLIEKRPTISVIDRFIENSLEKQHLIKHFTSFDANRINKASVNFKLFESIECCPSVDVHKAQTCRKRSQRKTCTTNKSHVETKTSTTKTSTPNCNYKQHRKTYSGSYDDNHDCINIDTNKTEWYIQLASNCYRNGFELHVNHLDKCSKNSSTKPATTLAAPTPPSPPPAVAFLRLPSSALFCRSEQTHFDLNSETVSLVTDLVVCSSPKSVRVAPHGDIKFTPIKSFSDKTRAHHRPHQLNTDAFHRIYCKNSVQSCKPIQCQFNRSIDETTTLPLIDTIPIAVQSTEIEQLDAVNAKNNMNSVAVDANNLPQNLQLSCQTIQYNYPNNTNSTFYREFQANGQPEPRTITESNNYNCNHWIDDSRPNPISVNNRIEVRSTVASATAIASTTQTATADIVNDLIEAFNSSFDVSDANQIKLPQIILSDFSELSQTPPPATPLFQGIQSTTATEPLFEYQLQEFQLSK